MTAISAAVVAMPQAVRRLVPSWAFTGARPANSHLPIGQVLYDSPRPLIGDGLATLPAHPDGLVFPALVADTAVYVGRVGAVLKVVPTSCC
jgi:hypothetical protein